MTLGDKLNNMSLNSRTTGKVDPVTESMTKGKAPTLGDVKQSVKVCTVVRSYGFRIHLLHYQNLVRSLIAAIQTLNALPSMWS